MLRAVSLTHGQAPQGTAPVTRCGPRAGGLLHAKGRRRPQRRERFHFLLKDSSFTVSIGEMLVLVQMASPPPAHAGPTVSHGVGGGRELRTAPLQTSSCNLSRRRRHSKNFPEGRPPRTSLDPQQKSLSLQPLPHKGAPSLKKRQPFPLNVFLVG